MAHQASISIHILCFLGLFAPATGTMAQTIREDAGPRAYRIYMHGELLSDSVFSEVSDFSEGKAYVATGDQYAYIDTNGQILTPFLFTVANDFKDGFAVVGDSFHVGVLNARMQLAVPMRYQRILPVKHGLFRVQNDDGLWGLVDSMGELRVPCLYELPPLYHYLDYIIVYRNGGYGVVNDCHEVLFNTSYQYVGLDGIGWRSGVPLRLFPDFGD